ncbi:MAG: hypothetical protein ACREMB_03680 [Candidatus Rokuibacteriota bacterium]
MAQEDISQADLESFATKLEQWGKGLSPKERAVLAELLRHTRLGETAHAEVSGYVVALPTFRQNTINLLSPLRRGRLGVGGAGDMWAQWAQRQY